MITIKIPSILSQQFDFRKQNPIPAFVAGWGSEMLTSGLGALGSLISGNSQAKAQREANLTNLRIAQQTNEMNRYIADQANQWSARMQRENNQFNRDMALEMFEKENAYNDPREQVKRMLNAGVNPYSSGNSMIAQSQGDMSTPSSASVPSPAVAQMQAAQVQAEPSKWIGFFQNIRDFAQVFDTLSSSKLKGAERLKLKTLLGTELDSMINSIEESKIRQASEQFKFNLETINLPKKYDQELAELSSKIFKNYAEGGASHALIAVHEAEKVLKDWQGKSIQEQLPTLIENLKKLGQVYDQQVATEKSKQFYNYAAGKQQIALANTEDALRELRVASQRIHNGIEGYDFKKKDATFQQDVRTTIHLLMNATDVSDEEKKLLKEKVVNLKKNNSWYNWNQFISTVDVILKHKEASDRNSIDLISELDPFD